MTEIKKYTFLIIEETREEIKLLRKNKLRGLKRLEDYDLSKIDDCIFYIVVKTRKGEEIFDSVKVRRNSPSSRHLLIEVGINKKRGKRYRSFEMKTRVPVLIPILFPK
ncbi:MAG: hypothetical protein P1P85_01785 [Patescibacteria group bacterium]|nr:hypothetical protein [Patescibacteria group bacterium]